MIRIAPPPGLVTPHRSKGVLPVQPVGNDIAVCEAGGMVRIDVHGQVFPGRVVCTLTPAEALRLVGIVAAVARKLGA